MRSLFKYFNIIIAVIIPVIGFCQNDVSSNTAETMQNKAWIVGTDEILALVIALLLIPIILMGSIFKNLVKAKMAEKIQEGGPKKTFLLTLLVLLFSADGVFANGIQKTSFSYFDNFTFITWTFLVIFLLELVIIVFFAIQINSILKPKVYYKWEDEEELSLWDRINSFRPIREESKFDTGHDYDGIHELDNIIPPWFTAAFAGTILFAGVYLYRYHYAHSAPLSIQEFKMEMDAAAKLDNERLAGQGAAVDENSVTLLGADDISLGKATFGQYCTPCHMAHGGSSPTGVGPNLTDDYWIHGGSIKDIFKSIKYGWPEKGMISWKDQLSANQIAQIASFIHSIHGSNPPGAKQPQGEIYKESAPAETAVKDTTKLTK